MGTRRVIAQNVIVTAPGVYPVYTNPLACGSWSVTEARVRVRNLIALQFRNFRITVPVAPGLGNAYIYTIRINGADTALSLTISGTAVTAEDLTTVVESSPDDLVSMALSVTGSPAAHAGHLHHLDVCGLVDGESWYADAGSEIIAGVTGQTVPFSPNLWDIPSSTIVNNVATVAGDVTKWIIDLVTAPGMGKQWDFDLLVNGVSAATITIADLAVTGSFTGTIAIAPGDVVAIGSAGTGSPATSYAARAVKFVADVDGESHYCGFSVDQPSTSVVNYNYLHAVSSNTYQATEASRLQYGGPTPLAFRRLCVNFFSVFGSGNHTVALRKNASTPSGGPSVTTATSGEDDAGRATIYDGDSFDVKITPNSPANAQYMSWGFTQYSLSPASGTVGELAWVHTRRLVP